MNPHIQYDICSQCGCDHVFEYEESVKIHRDILCREARDAILKPVKIVTDSLAYISAGAILALAVAVMIVLTLAIRGNIHVYSFGL